MESENVEKKERKHGALPAPPPRLHPLPEFNAEYSIPPRTVFISAALNDKGDAAGFGVFFGPKHPYNIGERVCTVQQTEHAAIVTAGILAVKRAAPVMLWKDVREQQVHFPNQLDQAPYDIRTDSRFMFMLVHLLYPQFVKGKLSESPVQKPQFDAVQALAIRFGELFFNTDRTLRLSFAIDYQGHKAKPFDAKGLEAAKKLAKAGANEDRYAFANRLKDYKSEDMVG